MLAFDVETTASDRWNGGLPFFIALHDGDLNHWWEFDVDPFTRTPIYKPHEIDEIADFLCNDELVAHNANFDLRFLDRMFNHASGYTLDWIWPNIEDSLIASHAFRNLWPHSLKVLRDVLLCIPTAEQDALRTATNHARRICRRKDFIAKHGKWRIASSYDPHWPAIKASPKERTKDISGWWVLDTWLPKAIVRLAPEFLPENSDWDTVLKKYAVEDVESTWYLWYCLAGALKEEGLYDQYRERKKLIRQTYEMESYGLTLHPRITKEVERFLHEAERHKEIALKIVDRKPTALSSTLQLQEILFDEYGLPVNKYTKSGAPSTDASVIKNLTEITTEGSPPNKFLKSLLGFRQNNKSCDYLTSYLNWSGREQRLHPNTTITGTRFTRQSSRDPNLQNVGTGKEVVVVDEHTGEVSVKMDFRLRNSFGPRPGRTWLSWDYNAIELRIWAYECRNDEFIDAFERGDSMHIIVARELHPKLADLPDDDAKLTKAYKRTKNGNFAIIYGAAPAQADATYGVKNAYNRIAIRFPEVRTFTKNLFEQVAVDGFVETLTGYRLYIDRDQPHKAVSAFVQGTAGAIIGRAMIDVGAYLAAHPEYDTHLVLQVHDELLFDAPKDFDPQILIDIPKIMASQGDRIGIPLPVSGDHMADNWDEGVPL